jgi:aryl-alcohol dehydrogenase-like predicted oxidoreductase
VHGPDPEVPIEDTLAALDGLVRGGKVRALGASNFPAWLLAWSVAVQDRESWAPLPARRHARGAGRPRGRGPGGGRPSAGDRA